MSPGRGRISYGGGWKYKNIYHQKQNGMKKARKNWAKPESNVQSKGEF